MTTDTNYYVFNFLQNWYPNKNGLTQHGWEKVGDPEAALKVSGE